MAEEPMLGLFDGETNFLDELAGTGSGDLGPPSGLDDGSMMGGPNTGMPPGMQQHMQQGQPQQGLIMGGQVSGAYQSNLNQDVSGYGMQISQSNMMGHQQYGGDQYGQYANSISKIGHNQGMMMGPGGGQSQQQGPFSPNMGGGMMQQQQTGYPGYNISGPHGHPQPQSMSQMSPMMSPSPGGWNQAQTSPNQQAQPHPHSQYMSPGGPQGQMSQYVNQGYHNQQIPQMNQYNPANKMAASSSAYIRPSNPMQGGMTSPPASMNLMGSMPVRSSHPGYPLHQATSASQHSAMMQGGYNTQLNQSMTGPNTSQYPSDIMSSHGPNQMSSGTMGQHYPQYSGNQQPRPDGPGGMSHYTTQAPTTGYGQPYPAMSQPRPGSSTPSPRPTPPPQSMTPNHSSSSQGTYGQSSLQQLEQLVSPGMPGSNPYQQLMQQNSTSPTGQLQQGPIYSSTNFPTTTVCSTVSQGGNVQASSGMVSNQGHMNMSGQMSMQNANNLVNYQNQMVQGSTAPMSPNQGMIPHGQTGIEIQRLEQQLQQLMSMPQTQQISQQMLEIQERLRMFRSQHQLHMQPQQHHQQMQQPRAKVHVQQQQGQMMSQQSQQMGQMRPMQGGIQSHIQPNHMNGQSALQHQHQQQQQGYPRGPSLSGQAGIPMSNSRSVPSPQKVQPFQDTDTNM